MTTAMLFLIEGAPPGCSSRQLVCPPAGRVPQHFPPISASPVTPRVAPWQLSSMQHQLAASAPPPRNRATPEDTCCSHCREELPHEAGFPSPRNCRESKHQVPVHTLSAPQAAHSFFGALIQISGAA